MTFGAFGVANASAAKAGFVLVPVPYERTTTYRTGTAQGPAALLAASTQVELFDEELRTAPVDGNVHTTEPVIVEGMPDVLADVLEATCTPHLQADRIVGCIGGEHSISLGPIRAAARTYPGLGVLQIDAHPDLRDVYEGTRFGHGCVMRRVLDDPKVGRLVQVGLRAVSDEDHAAMLSDERIRQHYAYEPLDVRGVIDALPARIYVSIDLDGFDPSIIPGTGTPEPGGLGWWDVMHLLRAVCAERGVVGFDIVELLPEPPSVVSDFAAAKLLFKMLSYTARR